MKGLVNIKIKSLFYFYMSFIHIVLVHIILGGWPYHDIFGWKLPIEYLIFTRLHICRDKSNVTNLVNLCKDYIKNKEFIKKILLRNLKITLFLKRVHDILVVQSFDVLFWQPLMLLFSKKSLIRLPRSLFNLICDIYKFVLTWRSRFFNECKSSVYVYITKCLYA